MICDYSAAWIIRHQRDRQKMSADPCCRMIRVKFNKYTNEGAHFEITNGSTWRCRMTRVAEQFRVPLYIDGFINVVKMMNDFLLKTTKTKEYKCKHEVLFLMRRQPTWGRETATLVVPPTRTPTGVTVMKTGTYCSDATLKRRKWKRNCWVEGSAPGNECSTTKRKLGVSSFFLLLYFFSSCVLLNTLRKWSLLLSLSLHVDWLFPQC